MSVAEHQARAVCGLEAGDGSFYDRLMRDRGWLCLACGAKNETADTCPVCAGELVGRVRGKSLVAVGGPAAFPCTSCGTSGLTLVFRRFRRVTGYVFFDRIRDEVGYYCAACLRRRFAANTLHTLCLGWLGVLAMLMRSPYALLVNVRALFAPPHFPDSFGALPVGELRAALAGARTAARDSGAPIKPV